MYIKKEICGFNDLMENSWMGAIVTLEDIKDAKKEEELMEFLDELFWEEGLTEIQLNDFLWFDRDYIYEQLGMIESEEE